MIILRHPSPLVRSLGILFALVASMLSLAHAQKPEATPKNILWIYLEDVSGWFSCYGEELIQTPHIDALAQSGRRYDRFYTPSGVCSTTRSAIVTGMMQTSIGAQEHRSCRPSFRGLELGEYDRNNLPEGVRPLPVILREAGYWTFNEGGKDDYNFEHDIEAFYDYAGPASEWGPDRFTGGTCLEGRKPGQPFFGQIQLGGGKLRGKVLGPPVVDPATVPVPPYYPDIPEVRERIANHYNCLLKTDEQVGEIIGALKESGNYENTLIFLFSDHGYGLHRHKQFLYEGGIRMPLIVAGPGITAGGGSTEELVSGIDISAATLTAAGIQVPEVMEGQDFLDPDHTPRDFVVSCRDRCDFTVEEIRAIVTPRFKYLRNYMTDVGFMQASYKDNWEVSKALRKLMDEGELDESQRVFFRDDKDPEELYDLENDPHEIHNLAGDPDYAAELQHHRDILDRWIETTGDQGIGRESDIGLLSALKRWGEQCVHPDFDHVQEQYAAWKAEKARAERGYLGVSLDDTDGPVVIERLTADTPAERAGLQIGDVLKQVGEVQPSAAADVSEVIGTMAPGDELQLLIIRDGKEQAMTITLGARPPLPKGPGLMNVKAPNLHVETWQNLPEGQDRLDLTAYRGKTVVLYCFQSW